MRSVSRRGLLAALALLLGACAPGPFVAADREVQTARARSQILVVPLARQGQDGERARWAARLLAEELSQCWVNVLELTLVEQSSPRLVPPVLRLARQAAAGERLDPRAGEELLRRHGVGQLLVVELYRTDQFWGRHAKTTQVGLDARLLTLGDGRILWQGRHAPEVSDAPGHGFDTATRRAVHELVGRLAERRWEWRDLPIADWPVLEYLAPN